MNSLLFARWRPKISAALNRIRTIPPKLQVALLCLALIGVAFSLSKARESVGRQIESGSAASEFHGERIFGSSVAALYKEKDSALSKARRDYADGVKTLKEAIDSINKRLDKIETLKSGSGADLPTTAVSPPGAGVVSVPTAVSVADSRAEAVGPVKGAAEGPASTVAAPSGNSGIAPSTGNAAGSLNRAAVSSVPIAPYFRPGQEVAMQPRPLTRGPSTLSFPVKSEEAPALGIVLPVGSYVRAKMLTGVSAPAGRPYPALLQLDYAHILPNRKRLDLSGCFMIVKSQGDLSTERLQMQATKMSCVGRDGRMFERDVSGFVADDKDNNFAVAGQVVSKQDRVAVMAFLSSVVEGVGKAVQQSQTTQQVTPLGGNQAVLTGDEQRYIAAGGASNAAAIVSQWYLKQAQGLLPTINVNSGQNVWVVMQESVNLPRDYFKRTEKGGNLEDSYSYVSRLVE